MKHLLDLQLWRIFKYVELNEVIRQDEDDKPFIDIC